jgi:hypothetical protein
VEFSIPRLRSTANSSIQERTGGIGVIELVHPKNRVSRYVFSQRRADVVSGLRKRLHFKPIASELIEGHMVFGWRTGKSLKNDCVRAVFVRFPFVYLKVPGGMGQNRGGVYRFAPGDRGFQKFPKRFFVRNRESKADGVAQKERSERSIRFLVGEFPIASQSTGIRSDGNRVLPDLHSPKNDVVRNYGQIVIVMGGVE